jgi:cysteinyl-tRNA synthetase, unknown class
MVIAAASAGAVLRRPLAVPAGVQNGIYVLQNVVPSEIAAAPVDVKVVEATSDGANTMFSASQVNTMRASRGVVVGYFSIGEAENYRDYFNTLSPGMTGPVNPDWPGNFQVAYWTTEWRTICFDYCDRMIAHGFDGMYMDVVDEYNLAWAKTNVPGGGITNSGNAMIALIQSIRDHAHAQNPAFKIWVNGAEEMLYPNPDHAVGPGYFNSFDGMYKEEVFYSNGNLQSFGNYDFTAKNLQKAVNAGRPAIAIEYITGAAKVANVKSLCAGYGIGYYIATPNLELDGVDTEGF